MWLIPLSGSNEVLLARAASKLECLNLKRTQLSYKQLRVLCDTISTQETKLKWLNLDGNNLGTAVFVGQKPAKWFSMVKK